MTATASATAPLPDFDAIRSRQRDTWASGDFAAVAVAIQPTSETLVEDADVSALHRVLDVATGSGNTAIAAARRRAEVTGIDFVPALLERARERAAAEGLEIDFREANAEELPFPDGAFDVVLSSFGVMFAPDQRKAAAELVRVCRPGGRIGLANWTAGSAPDEFFTAASRRLPAAPGLASPFRWGEVAHVQDLLGDGIRSMHVRDRVFHMPARSAEDFAQFFRHNFGPVNRAFAALDADGQAEFAEELRQIVERRNRATDGSLKCAFAYLSIVAER